MPRTRRVFKKRKGGGGRKSSSAVREENANSGEAPQSELSDDAADEPVAGPSFPFGFPPVTPSLTNDPATPPSRSSSQSSVSSSRSKIGDSLAKYSDFGGDEKRYDIVDIQALSDILSEIALCKSCLAPISLVVNRRIGLAAKMDVVCGCDVSPTYQNSERCVITHEGDDSQLNTYFGINLRLTYALRTIGKGETAAKMFCAMMNLPPPSTYYGAYERAVCKKAKIVAEASMSDAIRGAVECTGSSDLAIALDGSWQKRGYSSLNGVMTATSVDTGKVVDVSILSKYCRCPGRSRNNHSRTCTANYQGASGGMEIKGACDIYERSNSHNVRYTKYLGDGDSKAYAEVVKKQPYGEDCSIDKLECIGHIQKRMGNRLRKLKASYKGKVLKDGKSIGGKNRLTDARIDDIQKYYGNAIRQNSTSLPKMIQAIWAIFFHLLSTNEKPEHGFCDIAWCKQKKNPTSYDHTKHFHLDAVIMVELRGVFKDLSNKELLKKCLHGRTQNPNESFNHVIWTRVPKEVFVTLPILSLGVYDAVCTFNDGNIARCKILEEMNISPGSNCVQILKKIDMKRIQQADREIEDLRKKARQHRRRTRKKLQDKFDKEEEAAGGPSYEPGAH